MATPKLYPNPAPHSPEQKLNKVYQLLNDQSFDCPNEFSDISEKCNVFNLEPVVVKVIAQRTIIKSFLLPGTVRRALSPYAIFKNYLERDTEILEKILVTSSKDLDVKDFDELFTRIQGRSVLGSQIVQGQDLVTLELQEKAIPFYVVSEDTPKFIEKNVAILPVGREMTSLIKRSTKKYKLFLCYALEPMKTVSIVLKPNGPFLYGMNYTFQEKPSEQVVVNNSQEPALLTDSDNGTEEKATLTVNGDVAIFDRSSTDNTDELVGTENYHLYIGSLPAKGKDEFGQPNRTYGGLLTDNFILQPKENILIPDFVFSPEYRLRPLEELENFVTSNKHLPNVPSQKDVDKNKFYDVSDMLMGQLQNLEEMYLHTFEQEENINNQNQSIQILKSRLDNIDKRISNIEK